MSSRFAVRPGSQYSHKISTPPDPNDPDTIMFKLGRTNNLLKRLNTWEKQCKSTKPIFRYYWPGGGGKTDAKEDMIKFQQGSLKPGPPGRNVKFLERCAPSCFLNF